jgi:hypothetical protein
MSSFSPNYSKLSETPWRVRRCIPWRLYSAEAVTNPKQERGDPFEFLFLHLALATRD